MFEFISKDELVPRSRSSKSFVIVVALGPHLMKTVLNKAHQRELSSRIFQPVDVIDVKFS